MLLATNDPVVKDILRDEFVSPFPSNSEQKSAKWSALASSSAGYLSQAQASAQAKAMQVIMAEKLTSALGGGVPAQWMPQLVYEAEEESIFGEGLVRGMFSVVSFPDSDDPAVLQKAALEMGFAGAVQFVSSFGGIYGQMLGAAVKAAKFFSSLMQQDEEVQRLSIPWVEYSRDTDEGVVKRARVLIRSADWTDIFAPAMDAKAGFRLADTDEGDETRAWAPMSPGGSLRYSSGFGFMPGTEKMADLVQVARIYGRGPLGSKRIDRVTNTGDYYPAFNQFATGLWDQVTRNGNPDMYKVRIGELREAWRYYFETFFGDGVEQLRSASSFTVDQLLLSKCLTPFIVRTSRDNLITLGTDVSGFGNLNLKDLWNPGGEQRIEGCDLCRTDTLSSVYVALIEPALVRAMKRQKIGLARSLACAYVRPRKVDGMEAFAAFRDTSPGLEDPSKTWGEELRDYCDEMRPLFLVHRDRYRVRNKDVKIIDPAFEEKLRASKGITPDLGVAGIPLDAEPLDPEAAKEPKPVPPGGGAPFEGFEASPATFKPRPGLLPTAARVAGVVGAFYLMNRFL